MKLVETRAKAFAATALIPAAMPASASVGRAEAGCLAHARRKFHELWVNHQSVIGEQALEFFRKLYAWFDAEWM